MKTTLIYFPIISIFLISNYLQAQDGQKVYAPDSHSGANFGSSVSAAKDYAIIGAYNANNSLNNQDYSGVAYLFKKVENNWEFVQKLQENIINTYDNYGYAVDIDTNGYAVVGAYGHGPNSGTGFIYKLTDGQLIQQYQFPDHFQAELGFSVAIDGSNVIVGAPNGKGLGPSFSNRGEAWIYHYEQPYWYEVQKVAANDGYDYAHLGYSVDISGDYAIVGAWTASANYFGASSARIFKNQNGTWTEFQKLLPIGMDTVTNSFGKCVVIKGDYAIVGAPAEKITNSIYGVAYVFKFDGQNWVQSAILQPPLNPIESSEFGRSISITENNIIIGGLNAFYIYSKINDNWVFKKAVYHNYFNNGYGYSSFGSTVSCNDDNLIVGADDDCDKGSLSGASHFYQISSFLTSVGTVDINQNVEIYPNPFKSEIFVKINNDGRNLCKIQIVNSLGEIIRNDNLMNLPEKAINLEGIPRGIYFIRVENEGKIISRKIIKD